METWIDDAVAEIELVGLHGIPESESFRDRFAAIIARHHERYENAVGEFVVGSAKMFDEAQAEQRRLIEERDAWRELAELYEPEADDLEHGYDPIARQRIAELKAKLGITL